ncbi:hypothetical protein Q1695_015782 [Nippostrongylus brasiliensis]|nr:hypothetical protein Q1695_015782 [Nippostrongylus brasiliensis]
MQIFAHKSGDHQSTALNMLPIVVLLLLVATSATVNAQDAGMPEGGSGMEGSGCEGSGAEGSGCEASGEASGAPGAVMPPPM